MGRDWLCTFFIYSVLCAVLIWSLSVLFVLECPPFKAAALISNCMKGNHAGLILTPLTAVWHCGEVWDDLQSGCFDAPHMPSGDFALRPLHSRSLSHRACSTLTGRRSQSVPTSLTRNGSCGGSSRCTS